MSAEYNSVLTTHTPQNGGNKNRGHSGVRTLTESDFLLVSEIIQMSLFVRNLSIENIEKSINDNKQDSETIHGIPNYVYALFLAMYLNGESIDSIRTKTGYTASETYNFLRMGFINRYNDRFKADQMIEAIRTREQIKYTVKKSKGYRDDDSEEN